MLDETRKPLAESERRRSTFTEGIPVPFCNGESWHLPKPRLRFDFIDDDGESRIVKSRAAVSKEIDPVLDRIFESDTDAELILASRDLAKLALRVNYEIADDEFKHLLYYETDSPDNLKVWRAIVEYAQGDFDAPKPSAVGSETT